MNASYQLCTSRSKDILKTRRLLLQRLKLKYTELESRDKDDMDFPDEVDTPLDVEARKRFLLYRGIKSIKNCNWDPYENLPLQYAKIWRF